MHRFRGTYVWLLAAGVFGATSIIVGLTMWDRVEADLDPGASEVVWLASGGLALVCIAVFSVRLVRSHKVDERD